MRVCRALAVFCVFAAASLAQAQTPTFRTDHYSATDSLHAVAVELNEDGALDFVIGAGEIQLSNGNGTYRAGGTVPGITGFVVASGDFDNDSNADVVFTTFGSTFQIAYGDGTGGFRTVKNFPGIPHEDIQKAVAADFNRDGRLDLAVLAKDDSGPQLKILVLINTGSGFTARGPFAVETSFHDPVDGNDYPWEPHDLVIGDFDADAKADVAYSVISTNRPRPDHTRLVALFGDGAGNLGSARTVQDSDGVGPTSVASGDMNQDGKSDLAGRTGACSGTVCASGYVVFYGSTTRTFSTRQQLDDSAGFQNPVVADFNGDHRQDIAMITIDAAHDTFGIRVGTQNADGSFTTQPYYVLGFYHSQSGTVPARFLLTGDFDHNRKPDLMTVSDTDRSELVLINTTARVSASQFPSCTQFGGRGVHLCAPLSGATVGSPVTFRVAASDYKPVRKIELWLNGQKKFETRYSYANYSYADKALSLPAGTYNATLFSAGYDNSLQKRSFTFTVH
jgi:hypothetical protein